MSLSSKGKLNYRCPVCFARDIDMDMFYDEEKKEYYCIRCGYTGSEEDVLIRNEKLKYRYKCLRLRVVSFNDDNKPVIYKEHKKGEM